jgi:hypothetical protein
LVTAVLGTVAVVKRQCSRPGCAEAATATLTYHYGRSQVWLEDLHDERDPHSYDLCERHADRLQVPAGWHREDLRRHSVTPLAS